MFHLSFIIKKHFAVKRLNNVTTIRRILKKKKYIYIYIYIYIHIS